MEVFYLIIYQPVYFGNCLENDCISHSQISIDSRLELIDTTLELIDTKLVSLIMQEILKICATNGAYLMNYPDKD